MLLVILLLIHFILFIRTVPWANTSFIKKMNETIFMLRNWLYQVKDSVAAGRKYKLILMWIYLPNEYLKIILHTHRAKNLNPHVLSLTDSYLPVYTK